MGSLSLLQGIFPTQGLNPRFPHCRQILYQLSHKGSPQLGEEHGNKEGPLHGPEWVAVILFLGAAVNPEGFPGGSNSKESACNAGHLGLIPGWGRSPGEENGNPLQYSFLENPMDRGAWQATVREVTKSRTRLSD